MGEGNLQERSDKPIEITSSGNSFLDFALEQDMTKSDGSAMGLKNRKRRKRTKPHDEDDALVMPSTEDRRKKATMLKMTKPCYCLKRGVGSLQRDCTPIQATHRRKLRQLLHKLMRQYNWAEASGVLSVLLKGTTREKSISRNRTKYWASLVLLRQTKGNQINSRKLQGIYEQWMKKLGPMKSRPPEDRFAVQLEFILFCLMHGNIEDAHQAALCLKQEAASETDPMSNLVMGLTFFQLWYSSVPEELHLKGWERSSTSMKADTAQPRMYTSIELSEGHGGVEAEEASSQWQYDSNTSIRNDKCALGVDVDPTKNILMDVDDDESHREAVDNNSQRQDVYTCPAEKSENEESDSKHGAILRCFSIFCTHNLPTYLLPLHLPPPDENLENLIYEHQRLRNDHYYNAVKHLQVALHSKPPVREAFHPLIQILLLGDNIKEALDEVEMFSHSIEAVGELRLKAHFFEHFDGSNYEKLSTCFEDVLKKDPTCNDSLGKLINMHRSGDYCTEMLVEMLALHLDATYAGSNIWKELASCLLKLSHCDEDRVSACHDDKNGLKQNYSTHLNQIPEIFINPDSGEAWKYRSRWWVRRHFNQKRLASDISAGDIQLLTFKAATASYLYGHEFEYIVKATEFLEMENNVDMLSILQLHKNNSAGIHFTFDS